MSAGLTAITAIIMALVIQSFELKDPLQELVISNGNRTEWSPIRSVIIRVINKIGRPRSGSLICLSRVWLQTELDDTTSYGQLIIKIAISEKRKVAKLWDNGKSYIKKIDKGCINLGGDYTLFLWWFKPRLWLVDLNYNFKCYWLI